ncbi:MAG: TolC family protein [Lentisphaerae bacterium]|nr:TolC family protein [Lentisphaerota bacterium]
MKQTKRFAVRVLALVAAVAAGGCYNYAPVPKAALGNSYTHREKDQTDKLLDGISKLTLDQAQKIALKNNPTYIAAHHSVEAARFRYYQAMGAWAPTISASYKLSNNHSWLRGSENMGVGSGHHPRTDKFGTSLALSANWLIFDGLSREFNILANKNNVEYAKTMDADYCRKMMYAVAQAYNNVLLAIAQRRIAEENRKFQQISLKDTNYKFQAGAVPLSDVLNFEILMNSADADMINADYTYDASLYALAVLMGYPEGTLPAHVKFPIELDLTFHDLPAVEIYLDTALANRPDLKGYRAQLKTARYQLYQAYGAYSPTVNAFFEMGFGTDATSYRNWGTEKRHTYGNTSSIAYGLSVNWTLFNGLARYNTMREYQANLAVADYNVAAQWFAVVGEVRTAYANYIKEVKQTRLNKKIRDLAAKQRDLVDDEYRAGNAELTRLNEAQRDLVSYESKLASSYVAVQNAKAQLDYAVGANSAAFYESRKEVKSDRAPGLESLDSAKLQSSPQTAPQKPAQQVSVPGPMLKSGVPAARTNVKAAAKPADKKAAAKPAAKKPAAQKAAAKPAVKSEAEKAGIPASPTAAPRKK